MGLGELNVTAAFGPQHGMRGDKQDNMVETEDALDPRHGIPVFSLYGKVRYPTDAMLDRFDVLLVDLQDIGTRIYTYVTTLAYLIDACASAGKAIRVLDRPNPAGRPIEGSILEPGWESFVGAGPLIMRHGLTFGELARWFVDYRGHDIDLEVIAMDGYRPEAGPGFGWPVMELPGSTRAPTLRASIWPAASRAPSCWRERRCPKDAAPRCRSRSSARRTWTSSACSDACAPNARTGPRAH
jgi:hypothetical protein